MKTLIGAVLGISIFAVAALAINSQYQTRFITSATLTINVKEGVYLRIKNFTQDNANSGERGVIMTGIFSTPAPAPTPVPTPTPTLSTTASGVALSTGDKLNDTALLFGDNNPNGMITFTLFDPSNLPVYNDVVTVNNGNGLYSTTASGNNPGGFLPTTTGTYTWTALYSNDTNGNNPAMSALEPVIVTATPTPAPTATPTPTPIVAGVLAATILNPVAFARFQPAPTLDPAKPFIIAGPATLTIDPVPGATLSITYRKSLQPSGVTTTPTPTPTTVSTTSSTSAATTTSTKSSVGVSSASSVSIVATASGPSDDDEDTYSSTPTPTATPTPTVSRRVGTVLSTPTATPSP